MTDADPLTDARIEHATSWLENYCIERGTSPEWPITCLAALREVPKLQLHHSQSHADCERFEAVVEDTYRYGPLLKELEMEIERLRALLKDKLFLDTTDAVVLPATNTSAAPGLGTTTRASKGWSNDEPHKHTFACYDSGAGELTCDA